MKLFAVEDCNCSPHIKGIVIAGDKVDAAKKLGAPICSSVTENATSIGGGLRLIEVPLLQSVEDLVRVHPKADLYRIK